MATLRELRALRKHYGPGPHPSGTEQKVHAGGMTEADQAPPKMTRSRAASLYEGFDVRITGGETLRVIQVVEASDRGVTVLCQRINRDGSVDARDAKPRQRYFEHRAAAVVNPPEVDQAPAEPDMAAQTETLFGRLTGTPTTLAQVEKAVRSVNFWRNATLTRVWEGTSVAEWDVHNQSSSPLTPGAQITDAGTINFDFILPDGHRVTLSTKWSGERGLAMLKKQAKIVADFATGNIRTVALWKTRNGYLTRFVGEFPGESTTGMKGMFVDSAEKGGEPGTVYLFDGERPAAFIKGTMAHEFGHAFDWVLGGAIPGEGGSNYDSETSIIHWSSQDYDPANPTDMNRMSFWMAKAIANERFSTSQRPRSDWPTRSEAMEFMYAMSYHGSRPKGYQAEFFAEVVRLWATEPEMLDDIARRFRSRSYYDLEPGDPRRDFRAGTYIDSLFARLGIPASYSKSEIQMPAIADDNTPLPPMLVALMESGAWPEGMTPIEALYLLRTGQLEVPVVKHYGPGPHKTGTTQQEAHGQGISGPEEPAADQGPVGLEEKLRQGGFHVPTGQPIYRGVMVDLGDELSSEAWDASGLEGDFTLLEESDRGKEKTVGIKVLRALVGYEHPVTGPGVGTHWTEKVDWAEKAGERGGPISPNTLGIVLTAQPLDPASIDPTGELSGGAFTHKTEQEVTARRGAPIVVTELRVIRYGTARDSANLLDQPYVVEGTKITPLSEWQKPAASGQPKDEQPGEPPNPDQEPSGTVEGIITRQMRQASKALMESGEVSWTDPFDAKRTFTIKLADLDKRVFAAWEGHEGLADAKRTEVVVLPGYGFEAVYALKDGRTIVFSAQGVQQVPGPRPLRSSADAALLEVEAQAQAVAAVADTTLWAARPNDSALRFDSMEMPSYAGLFEGGEFGAWYGSRRDSITVYTRQEGSRAIRSASFMADVLRHELGHSADYIEDDPDGYPIYESTTEPGLREMLDWLHAAHRDNTLADDLVDPFAYSARHNVTTEFAAEVFMLADRDPALLDRLSDEYRKATGRQVDLTGFVNRTLASSKSLEAQAERGGFTVHIPEGVAPKSGWMASRKGFEQSWPVAEFTPQVIEQYEAEHQAELADPANFLGGWRDGDRVFLDISCRMEGREDAIAFGVENDQRAIYDLATGEEVRLKEHYAAAGKPYPFEEEEAAKEPALQAAKEGTGARWTVMTPADLDALLAAPDPRQDGAWAAGKDTAMGREVAGLKLDVAHDGMILCAGNNFQQMAGPWQSISDATYGDRQQEIAERIAATTVNGLLADPAGRALWERVVAMGAIEEDLVNLGQIMAVDLGAGREPMPIGGGYNTKTHVLGVSMLAISQPGDPIPGAFLTGAMGMRFAPRSVESLRWCLTHEMAHAVDEFAGLEDKFFPIPTGPSQEPTTAEGRILDWAAGTVFAGEAASSQRKYWGYAFDTYRAGRMHGIPGADEFIAEMTASYLVEGPTRLRSLVRSYNRAMERDAAQHEKLVSYAAPGFAAGVAAEAAARRAKIVDEDILVRFVEREVLGLGVKPVRPKRARKVAKAKSTSKSGFKTDPREGYAPWERGMLGKVDSGSEAQGSAPKG